MSFKKIEQFKAIKKIRSKCIKRRLKCYIIKLYKTTVKGGFVTTTIQARRKEEGDVVNIIK